MLSEIAYKEELEANSLVIKSMFVWLAVICIAEIMNELGIFYVPKAVMRVSAATSIIIGITAIIINKRELNNKTGKTKFFLVGAITAFSFITFTMLSFHVTIMLILPIIIASYYDHKKILPTIVCLTVLLIPVSIVVQIKLGTFSAQFLEFLVYLVNPQALTQEYIESIRFAVAGFESPINTILFFYGFPLALETLASGYLALCVYRGRESNHKRQIEAIRTMQDEFTLAMSEIVEGRDVNTGGHIKRTRDIMEIFVRELAKDDKAHSKEYWDSVIKTASLHDLGKISIADSILRKPSKLTDEEFKIIQNHSAKSGELISKVYAKMPDKDLVRIAVNIGRSHHERWDGTGYPDHLAGESIPFEARLMAYVDVADALLSKRAYKEGLSAEKALEIITSGSGTQFDPELMPTFKKIYPEIINYYSGKEEMTPEDIDWWGTHMKV